MHCSPKVRSPPQRLPMGTVYLNKNSNNGKIESALGDDGKRAKALFFHRAPRAVFFCLPSLPTTQRDLCGVESSQYDKTGNKYMQLVLQHDGAKRVSWKQCWSFYHPRTANLSCNKSGCCKSPKNRAMVLFMQWKFGHDNELTVLTRVSLQENVWLFLAGDQ